MKAYVDANVLARYYLAYDDRKDAHALMEKVAKSRTAPLPVTTLLRLELANALQRLVHETRQGGQWRISPEGAAAAWAFFEEDLVDGVLFQAVALSLEDIAADVQSITERHTAREGFRTYDVIHIAAAKMLGCDTFWSFNKKALKLAKLEGLKTN